MMHARRDSKVGSKLPQGRLSSGWLFALLVMCFAVLPHVTLAASMMRMPVTVASHHGAASPVSGGEQADSSAPCHETIPAEHPGSAAPPCCIIGCGLIAEAPSAFLLPVMIAWTVTHPPTIMLSQGLHIEPAERPPRYH